MQNFCYFFVTEYAPRAGKSSCVIPRQFCRGWLKLFSIADWRLAIGDFLTAEDAEDLYCRESSLTTCEDRKAQKAQIVMDCGFFTTENTKETKNF